MQHKGKKYGDMGHSPFLNSTCDIRENKQERHVALPFHKNDLQHRGPPSRALGLCRS